MPEEVIIGEEIIGIDHNTDKLTKTSIFKGGRET